MEKEEEESDLGMRIKNEKQGDKRGKKQGTEGEKIWKVRGGEEKKEGTV